MYKEFRGENVVVELAGEGKTTSYRLRGARNRRAGRREPAPCARHSGCPAGPDGVTRRGTPDRHELLTYAPPAGNRPAEGEL